MNISPCGVKLNTFKICTRKCLHITYTTISLDCLFVLCYQHQVLKIMRLGMVHMILPYRFTWSNEPWNTSFARPPLPKGKCLWHSVNFVISAFPYIIVLRETYQFKIHKYYRWHGINNNIPSVRYLFLLKSTYKTQMHKYVRWNGETISKEFTTSPFREHFPFDWDLEIFDQKFPNSPCSSSRYGYK